MRSREGFHWFRRWRLSGRQRRVLDALVAGRSNADIAADLGVSLDGAKWHVNQLLTETGLDDRGQLAEWWRGERESVAARRPVAGLAVWAARLALAGGAVAVAVWLLQTDFISGNDGDSRARASLPATTPAAATAQPPPAPSPTPVLPGAWILDLRGASVRTMPVANCCLRWLAEDTFVGPVGGSKSAIIGIDGQVKALLPGPLSVLPLQADGHILMTDYATGELFDYNPTTGEQRLLVSFGPEPRPQQPSRAVAISPEARRIAVGGPTPDGVTILRYDFDGSEPRSVFDAGSDVQVTSMTWSPDGSRLLIRTNRRGAPLEAIVVTADGRELMRRPISRFDVVWIGSDRLLFESNYGGGAGQAGGSPTLVDIATGEAAPMSLADRLICASPDGRLGVYMQGSARTATHRVVELVGGTTLLEVETRPEIQACDWTDDSTRVVLSFGGK